MSTCFGWFLFVLAIFLGYAMAAWILPRLRR